VVDKWHARWGRASFTLRDLAREAAGRAILYIDIKSASPAAADAIIDLCDESAIDRAPFVSSPQWRLLDAIGAQCPDVPLLYTLSRAADVDAILTAPDRRPRFVAARHRLLDAPTLGRLRAGGLRVFAWTVNTPSRARELAAMGVDGIVSDRLDVLASPGISPAREASPAIS
jgi:glycerophosphoryl diester phosphodiesterase